MQPYHHFTSAERKMIALNLKIGLSVRAIAKLLKRSPSSVCREIKRNSEFDGSYCSKCAHSQYIERRKKAKRKRIIENTKVYDFVVSGFKKYWSPEIISARAKKVNLSISCKTIYTAIKSGFLTNIAPRTHLRRRGKEMRGNRHKYDTIHPTHTIHERPSGAENRSRFGHWEGDTVFGSPGKGCLVTLIDRKSRFLIAEKSKSKRQKDVGEALLRGLKNIKVKLGVCSITLDNGSEFADFRNLENELKSTIYFADPHAPWQRGSNENINDVIRFFFPKGCDFLKIPDEEIQAKVELINNRPRKCLGNLSPYEYLAKKKKVLHLN
jgi:IS30 family transposase